jgi:general stress protein 26
MATDAEIRTKFWKALQSDRTMFLGLAEGEDGHARPMTAQLDDDGWEGDNYRGPIWFFSSSDNALVLSLQGSAGGARATALFASKGHDVWASVHGTLTTSTDPVAIGRLWNRFVAAWYEGMDDPKIRLIRLDTDNAEIWIDASSIVAGIKMLIGIDSKQDYEDKVAQVTL